MSGLELIGAQVTANLQRIVFAANAFGASLLALYIGLSLDLPRPYWAMATVYIVSQPLSGALRSKGVYRAVGTLLGAAAAVALVPSLANSPELLSTALALWVGGCLFVSLLDRSPRSYVTMLAGYTAAIIGFPAVGAPGSVFEVAVARSEEILLGVACATVVQTIVFPRGVGPVLAARIDRWMIDARTWTLDMLAGVTDERRDRDRRRLAADATELHILSTHLPFDTSNLRGVTAIVRALQDRMIMLLPLATAVGDRLASLRRLGSLPEGWEVQLQRTQAYLRAGPSTTREDADALRTSLDETAARARTAGWRQMLLDNLADRLGRLIEAHQDCRDLRRAFLAGARRPPEHLDAVVRARLERPLHRDVFLAFLSGAAAAGAIAVCCIAWISAAWPEGGIAAMQAAVFCSFFASRDDPAPGIVNFLLFTLVSIPITAVYLFGLLPMANGFTMLALSLAPVLLPLGYFVAHPRTSASALAIALGFANGLALQESFRPDFASFANSQVAQIVGLGAALLVTRLFRSVGADWSARRLLRAGWREIADIASGRRVVDNATFVSRLLDRMGQLTLRLATARPSAQLQAADALADLRAGLNIQELNALRPELRPAAAGAVDGVLGDLASHYRQRARFEEHSPARELLPRIDAAIGAAAADAGEAARRAVMALVGLRSNLFPGAEPYGEGATP